MPLLLVAVSAGGCSAPSDGVELVQVEKLDLGSEQIESFQDRDGQSWVRVRDVRDYDDAQVKPPDNADEHKKLKEMTFDEVVEALRPYSLVSGVEYTLANEDAQKLAKSVLAAMAADQSETGHWGAPPLGEPAFDGVLDAGGELEPGVAVGGAASPKDDRGPLEKVFGSDTRQDYDHMRPFYPYSTAGRMYREGSTAGRCTAFKMVDHHTAVTAAHCVHTGSSWKTRPSIQFGTLNSIGTSCFGMTVPGCWDGDDASCDYAVIQLHGRNDANCDLSEYDVGYLGWQSVSGSTSDIRAFHLGFPGADLPSGWTYPTLSYQYRDDSWVPTLDYNLFFGYFDTTGGHSGGPYVSWYGDSDFRARGIHKGDRNDEKSLGRRMDSGLYSWLSSNSGY